MEKIIVSLKRIVISNYFEGFEPSKIDFSIINLLTDVTNYPLPLFFALVKGLEPLTY